MHRTALGTALRWGLMVLLSVVAAWSIPKGEQLTFGGAVLAAVVVCGFSVKRGRVAWYALGALAVFWALWLGTANSDAGPLQGTLGYCGSVFEPDYEVVVDDAPPGLARQCRAVVHERKPFIIVSACVGAYALTRSCRPRTSTATAPDVPRDSIEA